MALSNCYRWALLLAPLAMSFPLYAADQIVKSPNDKRQYQSFTLPNQLKVLIVSDPDTDKAAAALDVFVGSGSDPEDRQGLAHFLEHMLFLGTEKYPQAGEYQQFISTHGGSHNAYTAAEHTNYFFAVDKDYLKPALDRFGQFFISPSFTAQYVEREKNAVHSEYQSKKKHDGWRALSVRRQVANPAHPFAKFAVGSLETLADRDTGKVRDDLIAFYKRHYSANIMALAVLGKEPLPELKAWVEEIFSPIKNIDDDLPNVSEALFADDRLPARINIVPVKDKRTMRLIFPLPSVYEHYQTKPITYIANLIGHEGKGSLLSLLKKNGWVEQLEAGLGMNNRTQTTFNVSMALTENGLAHVDTIASYVFQYLRLISADGIKRRLFDEQAKLSEINFRFQEKSNPADYVRRLAGSLQVYPPKDVLRGPYAMDNYDPELIRRFVDLLMPSDALLTVNARGLETDTKSPWFEAPYRITAVDDKIRQAWSNTMIDKELAIPQPNIFLPDDLSVKAIATEAAKPELIEDTQGIALWFQQDADFRVPRADFYFSVRSLSANDNPKHAVLTALYVKLIDDLLNEFAYPAQLTGLKYSIYKHIRGFSVRISGYNDKQDILLSRIVDILVKPEVDPKRFASFKDELLRELRNVKLDTPYIRALSEVTELLLKPYWSEEQRIAALEPLTAADLQDFIPELLERIFIVGLSHGNLTRRESLGLGQVLEEKLLKTATPAVVPRGRLVKLNGAAPYIRQLPVDHNDSASVFYFQGEDRSYANRARFRLLAQILKAPFYQDLRTEKQLGYVVMSSAMPLMEVPGIIFIVQSPGSDPIALEKYIEQFLLNYADTLAAMSEEEFARHKAGLLTRILERDKQLQERSNRYWLEIDIENENFDTREQLAAAVKQIDKQDLERVYRSALLAKGRKRLVIRAVGDQYKETAAYREAETTGDLIDDPHSFKAARKDL